MTFSRTLAFGIEEELLEDEPEGLVAESAELAGAEGCGIHSPDPQRAVVGLIEERQEVHQRGLAGAALADDRHGLPVINPEGHALQRVEPVGTTTVGTAEVMNVEDRGVRCEAHRTAPSSSEDGCGMPRPAARVFVAVSSASATWMTTLPRLRPVST